MAGCNDCYFKSPKCGTRGPEDSPFVIVGESPGIMEIHKKVPFIGPSGEVVEKTLRKVLGLEESEELPEDVQPYYTNAIQCLPRHKEEHLASACLRCRDRLLEELQAYPRKVILSLGNGALWNLLGNYDLGITRERGKLWKSPLASVGIVSAVHPSFLLRGGGSYIQFERDISYAIDLLREGDTARKLPNGVHWRILETEEEVAAFAKELQAPSQFKHVGADIETTGFSHRKDSILCLGVQHKPKLATVIPAPLITAELFENDKTWVWHNGKFDCKFLRHHIPQCKAKVDEDTMLLSYALNERRGFHDLDQVASDWLGSPNHKKMLDPYTKGTIIDEHTGKKRKRNYGDVPTEVLYKYLALDISDTYHLYPMMRPKVAEDKALERLYTKTLIPASEYLLQIEMNGLTADQVLMRDNEEHYKQMLVVYEKAFDKVSQLLGYHGTTNLRSYKQVQAVLYGHCKLSPKVDKSTDDDTLKSLPKVKHKGRLRQHPLVSILLKHRKAAKTYGTYIKNMWEKICDNGKIHPTFKLAATATGRLASEDPNGQNIPRDPKIRGQFIPRPGYAILEVDYSQAELRCLAELSQCPDLMGIFLRGEDLHVELSISLFGENFTKEDKMKAKTVNFGIPYGREAPSIAEAFKVSVAEAQSWIDGWAKRFPVAWAFIEKCRMAPIKNQTLVSVFGNKKRPGVVSAEKLHDYMNEAANFFHQNIASNVNLHAGIKLITPLREMYDTHIINTVHDCIVTETPFDKNEPEKSKARVLEIAGLMIEVMEREPLLWNLKSIPFKVEVEFGWRWGNVLKLREIEEMYDGDFTRIPDHIAAH